MFWAFRYCVLWSAVRMSVQMQEQVPTSAMSLRVNNIWATGWRRCMKNLSQILIKRAWPRAARACERIQPLSSMTHSLTPT